MMRKPNLLVCLIAGLCSLALATDALAQKPALLSTGGFSGLAHKTSGTASVYSTADGGHILRLEQFKTYNGPDVRVYLVKGSDATNDETIKGGNFVDLGALKGNVGDQNYTIPKNLDLDQYRSVSIWCRRFRVNFGAAPLEPAHGDLKQPLTRGRVARD
jgi:hypothetical protein